MPTEQVLRLPAVLCLALFCWPTPTTRAMAQDDDPAERKVMERFLGVLEKAPRRGTALDRVYGFHVERGSLDSFLVKGYQDRVSGRSPSRRGLVALDRAGRGPAGAGLGGGRGFSQGGGESGRMTRSPAYYLGQALVLVGQPEAAAEAFERALARKPARVGFAGYLPGVGPGPPAGPSVNDKALAVWDRGSRRRSRTTPRVQRADRRHALADEGQDAPRRSPGSRGSGQGPRKTEYPPGPVRHRGGRAQGPARQVGRKPSPTSKRLLSRLDPELLALSSEVRRKVEDVFLQDRRPGRAGQAYYEAVDQARTPDDVEAMARLGQDPTPGRGGWPRPASLARSRPSSSPRPAGNSGWR